MGAWRGLWVVLDRIDRQFAVPHALKSLIVEVDVGEFHILILERIYVHTETVILGGDFYFTGEQIFHWLVAPAVSKFEFESAASHGQTKELVTQADAEYGQSVKKGADRLDSVSNAGGISRAVRQEEPIGFQGQDVSWFSLGGQYDNMAVTLSQMA